ncbi:MAG TPA: hypothetical protein VLL08_06740 [Kineosporiaceae bacterium]|nr:hypothetical protein [Kineosporiaceae bacterium]
MTQPGKAARPGAKASGGRGPSSRERARIALATARAKQRERDQQIEKALTAAFDRLGDVAELQLALEVADRDLAVTVAALAELGQKPEAIAEHLELPVTEVKRLLKLAEESPSSGGAVRASAAGSDSGGAGSVKLAG